MTPIAAMSKRITLEIIVTDIAFSSNDCGQDPGTSNALNGSSLAPSDAVSINGSTDLSSCCTGESGACIFGIQMINQGGPYDYQILVDCQGPTSVFEDLDLSFTDQSGDTYSLTVYKHARETHTVSYNSDNPNIVSFTWD